MSNPRPRSRTALAALALLPFLAQCQAGGGGLASKVPSDKVSTSTRDAEQAARLISQYRTAQGLPAVHVSAQLNRAALEQARAVAQTGSLSHGAFASRMAAFGISGTSAENLSAGSGSVEGAIRQWKNSSGHNQNLLLPDARSIGLARADTPGAGYGNYWALVISQ